MKKALQKEQGFTLIEVLASIVILTIMFSVLSSFFVNSASYSNSFDKKLNAVQLSKSLLQIYQAEGFTEAEKRINQTVHLQATDLFDKLGLDSERFKEGEYTAEVKFMKASDERLILIEVTVTSVSKNVSSEIEGHVRK
ncbi:type II secretion system protein [Metabacillus indicus]|uniref:type II secretion system protein n=1 Tax=Metabacillus indicus TaxID=246786 RepID=UPI003CF81886